MGYCWATLRWCLLKNITFYKVTLLGTVYVLKKKIKNKNKKKLLIWENKKVVLENEIFYFVVIFLFK